MNTGVYIIKIIDIFDEKSRFKRSNPEFHLMASFHVGGTPSSHCRAAPPPKG